MSGRLRSSLPRARRPGWVLVLLVAAALLGAGGAAAVTVGVTAELIGTTDGHAREAGRQTATRPAGSGSARATVTARSGPTAPVPVRRRRPRSVPPLLGTVRVLPAAAGVVVPNSFLGLSTEYWDIPAFSAHRAVLGRVLALLQVRGDGPLLLRVGGDSASETLLAQGHRRRPAWARYMIGRPYFRRLAAFVRAERLRLYLDLGTVQADPGAAVAWARAALAALPRGALQALEIGNEPDLLGAWPGIGRLGQAEAALARVGAARLDRPRLLARLRAARLRLPPLLRASDLTPATYAAVFGAEVRALAAAFPHLALAGPALGVPGADLLWQTDALAAAGGHISIVTGHRYPLSACVSDRHSPLFPTVGRILSRWASVGMARSLGPAIRAAHRLGLPYVLTEFNSVTCGGRAGASNTFATALWAPAALLSLIRAGVAAANLHVRLRAINAPFTFAGARLIARPLLYGLALFTRTLGPDARLWGVRVSGPSRHRLRVWAVASRPGLGLLAINPGRRPELLRLDLPAHGHGTLERLLAPGPAARGGVSLASQRIGPSGRWVGHFDAVTVAISPNGRAALWLPGHSAARLRVAARELTRTGRRRAHRHRAAVRS